MASHAEIRDAGRPAGGGRDVDAGSAVVVYSHLPSEGQFKSERHEVAGIECVGDFDYWQGLAAHWDRGRTLVIVEHDIGVSDDLIDGLLDCPHPQCTYPYKLYWASTGTTDDHYAQRHGLNGAWIAEGAPICGFTGIGFCKVAPGAVDRQLERRHWSEVDLAVTEATVGPWHVHWPEVAHYHR